ncbi:MAG: ATP-binding cassette domain-containing protein [Methanofollis sp.]|uniref:ATP-binding cassette domain-containing protein n=1 Tax=Methanofollis sp. TaxID=2052835 RepID=UPI002639EA47|nr:ATP-binding cassette domain-containing protein [Methanofollis sp.]MDD4254473.1 ATP-binding cassette domain-containing protein [Methanofollis sp.]
MAVIETENLTRTFGDLRAVDGLNLDIGTEIFGLLGPNGSGKTTTVKMLTTLLKPTAGDARICGYSVTRNPERVRERISYVPQDMALDPKLTGRENVVFFAKLYGIDRPHETSDEAIALMDLSDRADDLVRTYSGGMRRRLELAQALVHDPEVLFLDEPTIGLDVAARRKIWEHITTLKNRGMTVFVTTHYMDEADHACDRVAIIDHGAVAAADTPTALKAHLCSDIVTIRASGEYAGETVEGALFLRREGDELRFKAECGEEAGIALARALTSAGMQVSSISIRQPTLDDVFLALVGPQEETAAFDFHSFRTMLRRR